MWRDDPRIPLLRELADPLRLQVVDRLANQGSATVSELARAHAVPMPQLSNHLRRLRDAGLVRTRRSGRSVLYELADPGLESLLPLLDRLTARVAPAPEPRDSTDADGRTCYSHLAGGLGVALHRELIERGAIVSLPDGSVRLGPNPAPLSALGVDVAAIDPGRRRFAFECLDATEHARHLAGALGDALAGALEQRGWTARRDGTRDVDLTADGARALHDALGLDLPGSGHRAPVSAP